MVTRQTRVVVGSKTHPRFVSKAFYDTMYAKTALYQLDHKLHPNTIRYFIPGHQVVERRDHFKNSCVYEIQLTDSKKKPQCLRTKELSRESYQMLPKKIDTYLLTTYFEECCTDYYLLVPNAGYYNTEIFTQWDEKFILYDNRVWSIHFRHVYVDPHDSRECIWFTGNYKYQVELCCKEDLQEDKEYLKQAVMAILPRSHLWE